MSQRLSFEDGARAERHVHGSDHVEVETDDRYGFARDRGRAIARDTELSSYYGAPTWGSYTLV